MYMNDNEKTVVSEAMTSKGLTPWIPCQVFTRTASSYGKGNCVLFISLHIRSTRVGFKQYVLTTLPIILLKLQSF